MTPAKRRLARFALAFSAIVMSLLVFEAILRLRGYQPFRFAERVNGELLTVTDNPELPYVLTPDVEGEGWYTQVKVNSHGFRDREFDETKGNRLRIVALGDSITFGSRLSPPSVLYPKRLEHLLQSRPSTSNAEVLNFGVTGYDIVNNVEHLRVRALRFHPDIVLLGFCVNDIGTSSTAMAYVRAAKHLSNPLLHFRTAQFILSTGLRRLAAQQASDDQDINVFRRTNRSRIHSIEGDSELSADMLKLAEWTRRHRGSGLLQWWTQPERIGFLEYGFDKLRTLQQNHGFTVVVIAIPSLDQSGKEGWRIVNQIVHHEARKFGFHFVDVFGTFEAAGLRKLRNQRSDDIHPNVEGHAILAKEIDQYLLASGLLD